MTGTRSPPTRAAASYFGQPRRPGLRHSSRKEGKFRETLAKPGTGKPGTEVKGQTAPEGHFGEREEAILATFPTPNTVDELAGQKETPLTHAQHCARRRSGGGGSGGAEAAAGGEDARPGWRGAGGRRGRLGSALPTLLPACPYRDLAGGRQHRAPRRRPCRGRSAEGRTRWPLPPLPPLPPPWR